jgi:hypothetical protein
VHKTEDFRPVVREGLELVNARIDSPFQLRESKADGPRGISRELCCIGRTLLASFARGCIADERHAPTAATLWNPADMKSLVSKRFHPWHTAK